MKRKIRPRRQPVPHDPRKASINLSAEVIAEIEQEAKRQGRSRSWIAQQAWLVARSLMRGTPAPHRRFREEDPPQNP